MARINWANPITKGLRFAALPNVPVNLVDGVPLTPTANDVSTVVKKAGKALTGSGSYSYPAPVNASSPAAQLFDTTTLSLLLVAQQDTKANSNFAFVRGNGSSAPLWGVGLHGGSFNGPYVQVGTYSYSPLSTDQWDTTTTSRTVVVTADGSTAKVWEDGTFVNSGSYTATTPEYNTAFFRQVLFGAGGPQNMASQTVRPSLALMWGRPLSSAEVASLSANPWQVFLLVENEDDPPFVYVDRFISPAGMRYQPQGAVRLNRSNPIANALVSLVVVTPSGTFDLVNPKLTFKQGSLISLNAGPKGLGLYSSSSAIVDGCAAPRGAYGKAAVQLPLTFMTVTDGMSSTGGNRVIGEVGYPVYGGYGLLMDYGFLRAGIFVGGAYNTVTAPTASAGSGIYAMVADGTNLTLYDGGKVVGTPKAISGTVTYDNSYGHISIFGEAVENYPAATGRVYYQAAWNRALSQAELKSLAENPWQLFAAQDEADFDYVVVTGGGTIISVSASSVGSSSVAALTTAIMAAYGSSVSLADASAAAKAIFAANAASIGTSTAASGTSSLFPANGAVAGTSTATGAVISVFPSGGISIGSSTASSGSVSISAAIASTFGTSTAAGNSVAVYVVNGASAGLADVSASSVSGVIVNSVGSSVGSSIANAVSQVVFNAAGSTNGSSAALGNAAIIAVATGSVSGNSTAQATVVTVFESSGMSVGASTINAIVSAITNSSGSANGKATVSGTTAGGLHFTAEGDRFKVVIKFSKYGAEFKGSPYTVTFKE
jgi:hypothetical protein